MKQSLTERHSLIVEDVYEKLIRDQGITQFNFTETCPIMARKKL